jgi:hypothetical protein
VSRIVKAVLFLGVLLVTAAPIAQSSNDNVVPKANRPDEYLYGFHIRPHYISAPIGKYLLIRYQDGQYGAIRFTKSEGDSGKWSSSEYEWHYGIDEAGHFSGPKTRRGTGKATDRFFPVFGRLAFNFGNLKIKFESIELGWHFPTAVSFFKPSSQDSAAAIMAPTDANNISIISVYDKNIRWFELDPLEAWIGQHRQEYINKSTNEMFERMKKEKQRGQTP